MVSAREVFGPAGESRGGAATGTAPSTWWRIIKSFYKDKLAWVALLATAVFTAYGGGAVMFWVHSVRLGEGGPNVPPVIHWALDSTAGFFGLTPALALILPLAVQTARFYVPVAGLAFALITVPGPIMHDMIVARGTWVADKLTLWLGPGGGPADTPKDVPTGVSIAYQFAVGLPTYIISVGLAMLLVRLAATGYRRLRQA